MLKVNFFKSLQFFQGRIIWITFGQGALGSETLCLSGVKICPWNTLGGNLGGQFFQVSSIFSGANNLDHFWTGGIGFRNFMLSSGVKICPWNTLGGNLGGQVEKLCPLGAEISVFLSILLISYRDFGILIDLVVYLTEYLGKIDQSLQTGHSALRSLNWTTFKITQLQQWNLIYK